MCRLLIPKIIVIIKIFKHKFQYPTLNTKTFLTNAYTHLDQKSKLFERNSIAIGIKELLHRKIYIKKHFFTKSHFEKFIN